MSTAQSKIQIHALLILFPLLCASACLESKEPPCPLDQQKLDEALLGRWVRSDNPEATLAVVVDEHRRTRLVISGHGLAAPKKLDVAEHPLILCKGTRFSYAAFGIPDSQTTKQKLTYLLHLYRVEGDELSVYAPTFDAYEEGIRRRQIRGRAWQTTWGSNVRLESNSKEILKWLETLKPEKDLEASPKYHRPNPDIL